MVFLISGYNMKMDYSKMTIRFCIVGYSGLGRMFRIFLVPRCIRFVQICSDSITIICNTTVLEEAYLETQRR